MTGRERGVRNGHRWPYQPLADALHMTDEQVAEHMGVARNSVTKWRERGMSDWHADKVCCSFWLNPENVWDDWLTPPDHISLLFAELGANSPKPRQPPSGGSLMVVVTAALVIPAALLVIATIRTARRV